MNLNSPIMPNIISKLKNLWKADGQEELATPKEGKAAFRLMYEDLEIGLLTLSEGIWRFAYSEDFKAQSRLKPLVDFPDVNKTYRYEELPPFFVQRIPGLGQPKVQKIILEEKIDAHNEVELLKRFGKLSISNPFQLLSV